MKRVRSGVICGAVKSNTVWSKATFLLIKISQTTGNISRKDAASRIFEALSPGGNHNVFLLVFEGIIFLKRILFFREDRLNF